MTKFTYKVNVSTADYERILSKDSILMEFLEFINLDDRSVAYDTNLYSWVYSFKTEEDAMLFRMRFL